MMAFNTDILSDIFRAVPAIVARASIVDPAQQTVPIVVMEKVIRGRFAAIRQAETGKGKIDLAQAYDLFNQSFWALATFQTLLDTDAADKLVQSLKRAKIRAGTRDMRIAAICMIHGATLVTRNARDYAQIPGPTPDVWN